jgi:hypothetical protein
MEDVLGFALALDSTRDGGASIHSVDSDTCTFNRSIDLSETRATSSFGLALAFHSACDGGTCIDSIDSDTSTLDRSINFAEIGATSSSFGCRGGDSRGCKSDGSGSQEQASSSDHDEFMD